MRRAGRGQRSRRLVPAREPARARRLRLHRQAHLPPRTHGARQGGAALADARRAAAVRRRRTSRCASRTSPTRSSTGSGGRSTGSAASRQTSRWAPASRSATTPSPSSSGEDTASGSFEVQEYRKPEFEVRVTPAERFVVQGGTDHARRSTPATTSASRSPTARSPTSRTSSRTTRRCGGATTRTMAAAATGSATIRSSRATRGWTPTATPQSTVPAEARRERPRLQPAHRGARHRRQQPRSRAATRSSTRQSARSSSPASIDAYVAKPGGTATLSIRAVSYTGEPQAARRFDVAVLARKPNARWDDAERHAEVAARRRSRPMRRDAPRGPCRCPRRPATTASAPPPTVQRPRRHRRQLSLGAGRQEQTDEDYGYDKYLELIAEKKTVQPGETARFLIRGAEFDSQVLVTKEAQKRLVAPGRPGARQRDDRGADRRTTTSATPG